MQKIIIIVITSIFIVSHNSLLIAGKRDRRNKKKETIEIREAVEVIEQKDHLIQELEQACELLDDLLLNPLHHKDREDTYNNFILTMRDIVAAQIRTIELINKNQKFSLYATELRAGIHFSQKQFHVLLRDHYLQHLINELLLLSCDSDFSNISTRLANQLEKLMVRENGFTALERESCAAILYDNLVHEFVCNAIKEKEEEDDINRLKNALLCAYGKEYYGLIKKFKNIFHNFNASELIELLEQGAHPNWFISSNGNTALTIAVSEKALEFVKILLWCPGINVNAQTKYGDTALMIAVKKHDFKIIKLLLEDVTYNYDSEQEELVEIRTADPNIQNCHGDTALTLAVRSNDAKMVEFIMRYNPNTWLKTKKGLTAYDLAERLGNKKMMLLLKN